MSKNWHYTVLCGKIVHFFSNGFCNKQLAFGPEVSGLLA